jgi:hypothetical protein
MTYLKCRWEDDLGDACGGWGGSWWCFEVRTDGYASRQVQVFDNGRCLRYGRDHLNDEFGGLADQPVICPGMPVAMTITPDEFESAWSFAKPSETDH